MLRLSLGFTHAAAFALGLTLSVGLASSAVAEGYWRYVDTQFSPTEAELQVLGKTPGRVDEKHVSGGFQAEYSGQGTIELFFKNDDVDRHVYLSRMTLTYGASAPMSFLVPGDIINVEGTVSFKSNFPGATAWGTVAVDNGDYVVDISVADGQGSGKGSFKVPGGGAGSTLRYIAHAYIGAYGGFGEVMTNLYEWVDGPPPAIEPSQEPPPVSTESGFSGRWSSNQGEMTLQQTGRQLAGTYAQDNGRVEGTVSGGAFSGYWGEDSSNVACPEERLGTLCWGRIELKLGADGRRFDGGWSYCDADIAGSWTGERLIEEVE